MSKQQPWTIILLVYVGSIVDLISLANTNDKRSRDRYNVELRFKVSPSLDLIPGCNFFSMFPWGGETVLSKL